MFVYLSNVYVCLKLTPSDHADGLRRLAQDPGSSVFPYCYLDEVHGGRL